MAAMKAIRAMKAMKNRKPTYYHNAAAGKNSGFKDQATRPNWRKVSATKKLKEAKEKVQILIEKEKKEAGTGTEEEGEGADAYGDGAVKEALRGGGDSGG